MSNPIYQKFLRMTDAEYHADDWKYLTSHQLKDFCYSPALYERKRRRKAKEDEDETTDALHVGTASHVLILEGAEAYFKRFIHEGLPVNKGSGKQYGWNTQKVADWLEAEKITKSPVNEDDYKMIAEMAANVRSHPECARLLAEGIPSGVLRADYMGVEAQSQFDWFSATAGITDLKTCANIDWFEADMHKLGYCYNAAFYTDMCELVLGYRPPFHFIAVEKKEPWRCGVWLIPESVIDGCCMENRAAIDQLLQCNVAGVFPSGYELPRVYSLPG